MFLKILIFLFPLLSFAADNSVQTPIVILSGDQKVLDPNIDYSKNCTSCQPASSSFPTDTISSPSNKQNVTLSVLTEEKAQEVFNKLASRSDIPFNYAKDGCFARAHKMAMLMDDEKIISGKVFLQGKFYAQSKSGPVFWTYHVTPVVLVNMNGKNEVYVMDPSIFDKPVPLAELKKGLSRSPRSLFLEEYFTNRFSYDLNDKDKELANYSDASVSSMNSELEKFSSMASK